MLKLHVSAVLLTRCSFHLLTHFTCLLISLAYSFHSLTHLQAAEKLDRIEEALNDLKKIKEIDSNFPKVNENIARLDKVYEAKMEQLKTETFGKLKELGNSILGSHTF